MTTQVSSRLSHLTLASSRYHPGIIQILSRYYPGILPSFKFAPGIVQNATLGLSSTAVRAALKAGDAESVRTLVESLPFSVFEFLGVNSKIFLEGKIKDIDLAAYEADQLGRVKAKLSSLWHYWAEKGHFFSRWSVTTIIVKVWSLEWDMFEQPTKGWFLSLDMSRICLWIKQIVQNVQNGGKMWQMVCVLIWTRGRWGSGCIGPASRWSPYWYIWMIIDIDIWMIIYYLNILGRVQQEFATWGEAETLLSEQKESKP